MTEENDLEFKESPALDHPWLKAHRMDADRTLVEVRDTSDQFEHHTVYLTVKEARALRDWLIEVTP
jgi:hypothetical protein